MGATSVTGSGYGSAEMNKGPSNGRNLYVSTLTPHVVAADSITLSGGLGTVTFPTALAGGAAKYVVMLTAETETAVGVTTKTDTSGEFVSFVVSGTGSDVVQWCVIKRGQA